MFVLGVSSLSLNNITPSAVRVLMAWRIFSKRYLAQEKWALLLTSDMESWQLLLQRAWREYKSAEAEPSASSGKPERCGGWRRRCLGYGFGAGAGTRNDAAARFTGRGLRAQRENCGGLRGHSLARAPALRAQVN